MKAQKLEARIDTQYRYQQSMQKGAQAVLGSYATLASKQSHLLGELLDGTMPKQWEHYPPDDIVDHSTGYQYYYHSHGAEKRVSAEYGHFHIFARTDGGRHQIDVEAEQAFLDRLGAAPLDATTVNLLCVSFDARGVPTRFFTVNRWVTGDRLLSAEATLRLLEGFTMTSSQAPTVSSLLVGLIQLFLPQITTLLEKRDEKLYDFMKRGKRSGILEDQRIELLTSISINVDRQIMLVAN